ncbi:hypothetical protein pb186bvf_015714 [Paramecium bursaria]
MDSSCIGRLFQRFKSFIQSQNFYNLNIYAQAKRSYQEGEASEIEKLHDKTQLVNIMHQPFYRNINGTLIVCKRPAITCKSNESEWAVEDIANNTNQEIYQCSSLQNWLTYEFARKYKLSQIKIQMYEAEQRTSNFELQILDHQKNWITVEQDQNRHKNIDIEFINVKPAYGIRIKGSSLTQQFPQLYQHKEDLQNIYDQQIQKNKIQNYLNHSVKFVIELSQVFICKSKKIINILLNRKMQDDNYINLMDEQKVQKNVGNSIIAYQKYVIVKSNDSCNIQLNVLKANQIPDIYTETPFTNWLTCEFMRKEKLLKIVGTFYYKDSRIYSYESEYLDIRKQWIPLVKQDCFKDLILLFNPKISAYGIRFRGKSNRNEYLHFNNLNIFAQAKNPYVEGQTTDIHAIQDKTQIVNIMEHQPFYREINNNLIACMKPVVICKFNESDKAIEDITNNTTQDIYQYSSSQNWLTYEFVRKYKLSEIKILLFSADKRKFNYELELLDQYKKWIKIETAENRYKHINIKFIDNMSAYGIRIRGKSNLHQNLVIVSLTILAQRGSQKYE